MRDRSSAADAQVFFIAAVHPAIVDVNRQRAAVHSLRLPQKLYAAHDDTLARSLITQMLQLLETAWADYQTGDGVLLKRGDIRSLIAQARSHLDDAPLQLLGKTASAPDWLEERADDIPRDRRWSRSEWMTIAAAWYFEALATRYVRARPMLRVAVEQLAKTHMDKIGCGTVSGPAIENMVRKRRRVAELAMVAGR